MVGIRSLVNIALLSEILQSSGKTTELTIGGHGGVRFPLEVQIFSEYKA
jgi:hypothetical protein